MKATTHTIQISAFACTVLVLAACAPNRLHTYAYGTHVLENEDPAIADVEYHTIEVGMSPGPVMGSFGGTAAFGDDAMVMRAWAAYDFGFFFKWAAELGNYSDDFRVWVVCRPRIGFVWSSEEARRLRSYIGGAIGLTFSVAETYYQEPTALVSIEYEAADESGDYTTEGWWIRYYRVFP